MLTSPPQVIIPTQPWVIPHLDKPGQAQKESESRKRINNKFEMSLNEYGTSQRLD